MPAGRCEEKSSAATAHLGEGQRPQSGRSGRVGSTRRLKKATTTVVDVVLETQRVMLLHAAQFAGHSLVLTFMFAVVGMVFAAMPHYFVSLPLGRALVSVPRFYNLTFGGGNVTSVPLRFPSGLEYKPGVTISCFTWRHSERAVIEQALGHPGLAYLRWVAFMYTCNATFIFGSSLCCAIRTQGLKRVRESRVLHVNLGCAITFLITALTWDYHVAAGEAGPAIRWMYIPYYGSTLVGLVFTIAGASTKEWREKIVPAATTVAVILVSHTALDTYLRCSIFNTV